MLWVALQRLLSEERPLTLIGLIRGRVARGGEVEKAVAVLSAAEGEGAVVGFLQQLGLVRSCECHVMATALWRLRVHPRALRSRALPLLFVELGCPHRLPLLLPTQMTMRGLERGAGR